MNLKDVIINTLKNEVLPAMGCTEPVAVALACAKAREVQDDNEMDRIEILVSPNIYKNGLGVGVPNTDEVGLSIAGALGMVGGASEKSLRVLEDITNKDLEKAHELLKTGKFILGIKDTEEKVYVEVNITSKNNSTKLIIEKKHNLFTYIEKNGRILLSKKTGSNDDELENEILFEARIKDIIKTIEEIDPKEISFLLDGISMNEEIATRAVDYKMGVGVGFGINQSIKKGILCDDFINNAMMLTAAGADARMAGLNMPVMSSNGSGNNGLTAILPIAVYQKRFKPCDESVIRALAISHILNCYIKNYIGRLSPLCGCGVAAATGASAAITWLMGGDYKQIDGAIKNMIANISGIICDGAKGSCALKLSTAASASVQSALLAINDSITLSRNGIIGDSSEETIRNLGVISSSGMNSTDKVILDIMKNMA